MRLADFIREEINNSTDVTLAPIIEGLTKYLAKKLKTSDHAYIRWEYEENKEEVNEDRAFVYYSRKVALQNWLDKQGFQYWNAVCHLDGKITGINVSL